MAFDILVVGGGINGCGIARDAAGRGLSVLLVEAADLASATSSASTKLIHGGLRYLEHYEFRLVREALQERELLLSQAPHIIWPMRFVLPHDPAIRPAWLVRIGLFLYDHLAKRQRLPACGQIRRAGHAFGAPLQDWVDRAFVYSDCWVDDARLVSLVALDARERGASVALRTRLVTARREGANWSATLMRADGTDEQVDARAIVNAAGPWVGDVLGGALGVTARSHVRLVKGSHIVVDRLYQGEQAYMFQNPDGRIIFVIPYEGAFTLIGTTDVAFEGDPRDAAITPDEIGYLIAGVERFMRARLRPSDIRHSFSGVRPLYDDGTADAPSITRDYVLELDRAGGAPVLSVYGGKITTFRRLAEHALADLAPFFPSMGPAWTAEAVLPGGDVPDGDIAAFAGDLRSRHPFLSPEVTMRLAHAYGTRASDFLGTATKPEDLGQDFGHGFTMAELDYLRSVELAASAEDVLWRRSKLGLHLDAAARAQVAARFGATERLETTISSSSSAK
ncbi:MAG: glycerol-3-phosphate dehydrogenase [Hyphomicrobiales bacterium]|nr:glycerol-3-phosphate dehydrogenase [Hyphomicrobiales bacterium]